MSKNDDFSEKKGVLNQPSPVKEKIGFEAKNEVLSMLKNHITDDDIIKKIIKGINETQIIQPINQKKTNLEQKAYNYNNPNYKARDNITPKIIKKDVISKPLDIDIENHINDILLSAYKKKINTLLVDKKITSNIISPNNINSKVIQNTNNITSKVIPNKNPIQEKKIQSVSREITSNIISSNNINSKVIKDTGNISSNSMDITSNII
jgi:hypothetical protein